MNAPKQSILFTIGHSNHPLDVFVSMLKASNISAVADVRSYPYSRFSPQFDRQSLQQVLSSNGIRYIFLGNQLGGRPEEDDCYNNGLVVYSRMVSTAAFIAGLKKLGECIAMDRVALMCSEKDPATCHRMIAITRQLRSKVSILHVLENGDVEANDETERRLLRIFDLPDGDLFHTSEERVDEAYERQARKIACRVKKPSDGRDGQHE